MIDSERRRDIDGLRAIAVLLVAVFHFNPAQLPGGYVGVDAFFVISGYLITSKIVEMDPSIQGLLRFYLRRAIRLMPAFVTTALACVVFGLFYLSPADLNSMGRSILSALFFHSNFHFMKNVDYFAEGTHDPFMLHTWSLSVEWQFYFILPLIFSSSE